MGPHCIYFRFKNFHSNITNTLELAMKVRVVCKYYKSEKNATVISSERHRDDSGQGRADVWINYKVRILPHQFGRKSCTDSGKTQYFTE